VLENAGGRAGSDGFGDVARKDGAQIEGDGTSTLRIRGVEKLHGTEHTG